MEDNKKNILVSVFLTIMAIIYTILVKIVNVGNIGPKGTKVGFSNINLYIKKLIGSNMTIYKIAEVLGYIALLIVAIYGLIGLIQLIKRKSLLKVDRNIIILGIFYVIVLMVYCLFEKIVINYRPILIDNKLEASFPSSHTMLAICVSLSAIAVNKNYIKNKKILNLTNIFCYILMITIVLTRFLSGVHWFTDIVGGLIISSCLMSYFYTMLYYKRS